MVLIASMLFWRKKYRVSSHNCLNEKLGQVQVFSVNSNVESSATLLVHIFADYSSENLSNLFEVFCVINGKEHYFHAEYFLEPFK